MDSQVQNESAMQYGHMPLPDRRDTNLDSNGSTPFQAHQGLGQALGNHHLPPTVAAPYSRAPDNYRNLSTSPPGLTQNGTQNQPHPGASSSHSSLAFVGQSSKRKQDGGITTQVLKRRRDADDPDAFDMEGGVSGAKHWTDEEKTKLFSWLMGPGQDEHWNALRATKNSCLRECAVEVFGNKKTYQALKGCYERNFNLFKQIYAFETFPAPVGTSNISSLSEADRLREYERRLQTARKSGCDVGNITARTIDHWHRVGWYDLFYRRWHGDPATTRPVQSRGSAGAVAMDSSGADDTGLDNDPPIDFTINEHPPPPPVPNTNTNNNPSSNSHANDRSMNHHHMNYINPQALRDVPPVPPSPATTTSVPGLSTSTATSSSSNVDPPVMNVTISQSMVSAYMQFLQVQTQTGKMKLEYMRRKEEREERESVQRREMERLKMEREAAQFEHTKHSANVKQTADRAIELLSHPGVDASVKQTASDYLKRLFSKE